MSRSSNSEIFYENFAKIRKIGCWSSFGTLKIFDKIVKDKYFELKLRFLKFLKMKATILGRVLGPTGSGAWIPDFE